MSELNNNTRFSADELANRLTFKLHTASRLVQQMSGQKLKNLELSQAQWRALSGICTQPGTTLQQLTAFAQISQPLMSQAVKALEERNLVSRKTPQNDKRSSVLSPNQQGLQLYEQAYAAMLQVEQEMQLLLSDTGVQQLKSLLDVVVTGINQREK
ncbi:MAG: hypothetical protein OFPI_19570 [Osedax symbiont Rs2]|nr:MAG: hypothetical protein OFPI_19570 [Osedax symbiont Rs2]